MIIWYNVRFPEIFLDHSLCHIRTLIIHLTSFTYFLSVSSVLGRGEIRVSEVNSNYVMRLKVLLKYRIGLPYFSHGREHWKTFYTKA